jgi:hypothetical protein
VTLGRRLTVWPLRSSRTAGKPPRSAAMPGGIAAGRRPSGLDPARRPAHALTTPAVGLSSGVESVADGIPPYPPPMVRREAISGQAPRGGQRSTGGDCGDAAEPPQREFVKLIGIGVDRLPLIRAAGREPVRHGLPRGGGLVSQRSGNMIVDATGARTFRRRIEAAAAGKATWHSPNVRGFLAVIGRACNPYLVATRVRGAARSVVATDSPGEISGPELTKVWGPAMATSRPHPAAPGGLDRIHSPARAGT